MARRLLACGIRPPSDGQSDVEEEDGDDDGDVDDEDEDEGQDEAAGAADSADPSVRGLLTNSVTREQWCSAMTC